MQQWRAYGNDDPLPDRCRTLQSRDGWRRLMGENVISVAASSAKREWWDLLRLDDPRYPRPALVAGLRTVGRLGWLPVTVYLGNAAENLVSKLAAQGTAAVGTLNGLAGALQLQGVWQLAQQSPMAAAGLLTILVALGALIALAQRDTRREA